MSDVTGDSGRVTMPAAVALESTMRPRMLTWVPIADEFDVARAIALRVDCAASAFTLFLGPDTRDFFIELAAAFGGLSTIEVAGGL